MPKAKSGNFTLKKIVAAIPAHLAAHRFAALQRSGRYSELRFIQRGKSSFDIVGYQWPDKGVRRKLGIGNARKNPNELPAGTPVSMRLVGPEDRIKWIDGEIIGAVGTDNHGYPVYRCKYELGGKFFEKVCFGSDISVDIADENPTPKKGATRNQVLFGLRGKTLVGWINKETPTQYQISYKVGPRLHHVWRAKDKVKFQSTGKYGRVKNNCPKTANPGAELSEAVRLSKKFNGFVPRRIRRVNIQWPNAAMLIGPCVRLDYFSKKWDGKGKIYFHEFEKPCQVFAAAKPQPDGDNLLIVKGKFEIRPEGITG